ncbi:MAG: tetratricopeptide repeat protein [Acetobacteraceae bacterium]|nr:tetratricopeptide repeat protein [Acetobacteraceae bacterium]
MGRNARARGDHAAALRHFAAAAAAAPSNPWPRLEQAATLRSLGRLPEAEALYAAVLADHPGQFQALLGLGLCARARGARTMAAAHFRHATEANPWAGAAWTELATELCDAGDYDAARDAANKLLAHDPGNLQGWMILGRTERSASRRPEALAAFRRAQECNPRNPLPLIEMAIEMRAAGQPWEARRLLEQALEIDGQNLHALAQLGELARLARDYDAALALFSRARSLTPSSPWAYLGAAQTLSDLGRCDKALMLLDEAERNCGSSPDLTSKRIDLLQQVGEWHRAHNLAREAAAAAPHHFGLWTQRFRMELKLSTPEEVEACLGAAPATSVGDLARVHHFRGQAAEEAWRIEEAIAHYERALRLRPEDSWTLADMVRARILSLDLELARADLVRLTRLTASPAILQGRLPRASQTHLGQILDEFLLDHDALTQLMHVREMPPDIRIERLCAIVRHFPDYTPAGMMLLIALRQTGWLMPVPTDGAPSRPAIPTQIVQYWNTPDPPPEIADLMQDWRNQHPNYNYRRFSDADAQTFLRENYSMDTLKAYQRARELAQKADIFRLAYLFAEGGFYIDADDRCLAPIRTIVPPNTNLVLYQENFGTVGNNFIGVVPQHPIIGLALDLAISAINRGDNELLWFSTGPGLLTRALARTLASSHLALPAWLRSTTIFPRVMLHRAIAMHCRVAYKNTEQHWSQNTFARRRRSAAQMAQPLPSAPV